MTQSGVQITRGCTASLLAQQLLSAAAMQRAQHLVFVGSVVVLALLAAVGVARADARTPKVSPAWGPQQWDLGARVVFASTEQATLSFPVDVTWIRGTPRVDHAGRARGWRAGLGVGGELGYLFSKSCDSCFVGRLGPVGRIEWATGPARPRVRPHFATYVKLQPTVSVVDDGDGASAAPGATAAVGLSLATSSEETISFEVVGVLERDRVFMGLGIALTLR